MQNAAKYPFFCYFYGLKYSAVLFLSFFHLWVCIGLYSVKSGVNIQSPTIEPSSGRCCKFNLLRRHLCCSVRLVWYVGHTPESDFFYFVSPSSNVPSAFVCTSPYNNEEGSHISFVHFFVCFFRCFSSFLYLPTINF